MTQSKTVNHVPEFDIPAPSPADKALAEQVIDFKLSGELFTLRRPKGAVALTLLSLVENENGRTVAQVGQEMLQFIRSMIGYVQRVEPAEDGSLRGQDRIWQRLLDPDDQLDIQHLAGPFSDLLAEVYPGRPTMPSPASTPKRATRSRVSGAGTRSTPAKTSGI